MRQVLLEFLWIFFLIQVIQAQQSGNSTIISHTQPDSSNLQAELAQQPDICSQDCQTEQKTTNTYNSTIFVVSCLCGLVLSGLLTILICTNKRVAKCTKKLCRKNRLLPALRQKYDVISSGLMSESQFEAKCKNILRLFQKSVSKSVFRYKTSNQENDNYCKANIEIKKENAFHYLIQIEGEDQLGEWCGSGSILCQSEQVFIWFTQQYNDISKQWKEDMRIFISLLVAPQAVNGKWFSNKKDQLNQSTSGTWILFDPSHNNSAASSQSIQSIQEPV